MSTNQLKLKIITPERLVLEELADQVSIPTVVGEITVLPNHIPLVVELAKGDIVSYINKEPKPYAVVGGFIDIKKNEDGITEVAILADFAEHVSDLSEEKIREAKERSEQLKKEMENNQVVDFEHFQAELERSLTRVKIADKWKSKKYRK
jgi:F-type H+-transporting ATPase subunit epsilon